MKERGSLEVVCGCMFSGKTEELIRRVKREYIAKSNVQVFKSHLDTRYSIEKVYTHDGEILEALQIPESLSSELLKRINPETDVIAIDEVQFFDNGIVELCEDLASKGVRVIVAGLDLDFRGEPFPGPMPTLMAKADRIDKLTAVCVKCGQPAVRSQRLVDGKPANWDEATLVVGAQDKYEAVCRLHHQIERPTKIVSPKRE